MIGSHTGLPLWSLIWGARETVSTAAGREMHPEATVPAVAVGNNGEVADRSRHGAATHNFFRAERSGLDLNQSMTTISHANYNCLTGLVGVRRLQQRENGHFAGVARRGCQGAAFRLPPGPSETTTLIRAGQPLVLPDWPAGSSPSGGPFLFSARKTIPQSGGRSPSARAA